MVDKAGHYWSLEGYTRTVIRTTVARTYNDLRIQSMKDFDSVLATMSSHPASRPACAPIQGKIVNIVPRESPDAILNILAFMITVMVNQVYALK